MPPGSIVFSKEPSKDLSQKEDEANDQPVPETSRFEGGLDLDPSAHDNPTQSLEIALNTDDWDRALGAYRLLATGGVTIDLPLALAGKLGGVLEGAEMPLDAARVYREGAEKDLANPEAAALLFRAACLLLGPAYKPEPGADLLLFVTANFPRHHLATSAEQLFEMVQASDGQGVADFLAEQGIEHPDFPRSATVNDSEVPRPNRILGWAASERYPKLARIFQVVFWLNLVGFVIAWHQHDSLKNIDQIHPALRKAPRQRLAKKTKPLTLTHDGKDLLIKPKFDYVISGLVVSKDDYRTLGLSRGNLFMMDICLIWGSNALRRVHQKSASFEHHGNVCYSSWQGRDRVRNSELSNNHVLLTSDDLKDAFEDLERGDQIRIKGRLIDVLARPKNSAARPVELKTSTTRTDKGMGACEIIHVTELQLLARGNAIFDIWYRASFLLLVLQCLVLLTRFFLLPVGRKTQQAMAE